MVIAAVDRITVEIRESVVHPAHVPLEAETEPAQVDRAGYAGNAVDSSAIT